MWTESFGVIIDNHSERPTNNDFIQYVVLFRYAKAVLKIFLLLDDIHLMQEIIC